MPNNLTKIRIKNLMYNQPVEIYDIIVDRTTVLGNPYHMKSGVSRADVCKLYRQWLKLQIIRKQNIAAYEIERLRAIALHYNKLNLYCWCWPEECHAESIRDALLYREEFGDRYYHRREHASH